MKKYRLLTPVTMILVGVLFLSFASGCAEGSGSSASINVISREDGSGTRGAFIELFGIEVSEGGNRKDMTTKEATVTSKTDVMLTTVSGDKNAIGYVSIGSLNENVKALAIDGVAASIVTISNGTYGIKRPFNIAIKGSAEGLTKDFIDYVLSADGQEVVSKSCVPVSDSFSAYAGSRPEGRIVIAGSSSVNPVMEKLVEAYKNINPNATIEIQVSDSTGGMTATIDGTCDIGMASRDLKDSEKAELTEITIAIDGIAVIVNKNNDVDGLTKEQVRQIFTGEITVWGELN